MKPDYDAIAARFNVAAWGITAWERSDRNRPEGLVSWERWCREHAYYDIEALLTRARLLEAAAVALPSVVEWADDPELRHMLKDRHHFVLDADLERARQALAALDAAPVVVE